MPGSLDCYPCANRGRVRGRSESGLDIDSKRCRYNKRDSATARQRDSATARQRDSATARQRDSATARQRDSATARQRDSATARQRDSATARQRDSATARQRDSATARQRDSATARQRLTASALRARARRSCPSLLRHSRCSEFRPRHARASAHVDIACRDLHGLAAYLTQDPATAIDARRRPCAAPPVAFPFLRVRLLPAIRPVPLVGQTHREPTPRALEGQALRGLVLPHGPRGKRPAFRS